MTTVYTHTNLWQQDVSDINYEVVELSFIVNGGWSVEVNGMVFYPGEGETYQAIPGCVRRIKFDVKFLQARGEFRGCKTPLVTLRITELKGKHGYSS
jgi:hypothetical protein